MIKKLYIYGGLFIVLTFSGCLMGPDFQKPEYAGPEKFRFDTLATDSVVNLRWWELFDDPVLVGLINTSLERNRNVLIAASRVNAAKANIEFTEADQWPSFRYGMVVNGSGFDGSTSSGFSAYPEFAWEIGFWGKYRRLNEAARAEYLATEDAKRMVQLSLITAVASSYYAILVSYDQLEIATGTLDSRDSGVVIMTDKYEAGMISKMDLNQAVIQRDVAATVVPLYKRVIAINENSLSILIGTSPQGISTGTPFHDLDYELDIPPGIPSDVLQRRPDVRQTEAIYMARNAEIGVAEALRWPSFSLTGSLGAASNDLTDLNAVGLTWSAAGGVFGPIFEFEKNKRRVEIAEENARIALLDYEQATLQAFREVEDALVSISTYREELAAQESRTLTAIESEVLAHVRYDEGSTTYLEVLEQQRQSFSAQLDLLTTRLNLLNSYILLYKALGGGWISAEEEAEYNR